MSTKIEWCDMTWNPVMGCKTGCPYCYAERINKRFKYIKRWDMPEWREKSFNKKFPKIPSRIFVNSMSDIEYWEVVWMNQVLEKIKEYPQHTFLFLTKSPLSYKPFIFSENCFIGCTISNNEKLKKIHGYFEFISFEPLLTQIDIQWIPSVEWVIIGAETGNRKNKIIPKKEWIEEIIEHCKYINIPILMKNNLAAVWKDKLIQEYPK